MSSVIASATPRSEIRASALWGAWRREGGALLRLAAPIMLIALVNMGMSVTDTAMIAAFYGTEALASVAVGSDLYSIMFYLGAGVIGGVSPFYAAAVAKSDAEERVRLERTGWIVVGLAAAVLVPLVWCASDWLAIFGLNTELLKGGQGYTRAMALTLAPMLGVTLFRTLLTSAEKPKVFLYVTIAMLPVNAITNYALMEGIGWLPTFGPVGAGLASLLVASASLFTLALVYRHSQKHQNKARSAAAIRWHDVASVLRVGLPIGVATIAEVGIYLAATLYAARLGAADVAAHTVALRTAGVAYAVPVALLQASVVRMARAQGLKDYSAARAVITSSLGLAVCCGLLLLIVLMASATSIAGASFDTTAAGLAAAQVAVGLLLILGLMEIVGVPGAAASGLLRGQKDTRTPMLYGIISLWGVGAPLGVYLCEWHALAITGIWIGLGVGALSSAILTLARLRTKT